MEIATPYETYTVNPVYDAGTGVMSYTPAEDLPEGLITVQFRIDDVAGNSSTPLLWSFTVDSESPTGSIKINSGLPSTISNFVTLNIEAIELSTAIDSMMISNDGVFDTEVWQPYNTTVTNWELTPTPGIKTVYIKFRDLADNESDTYDDSIVLVLDAPNTFITSAPPSQTEDVNATFEFISTIPGASFSYKLNNDPWTAMSTDTTVTFIALEEKNHYFQVRSGFDLDNSGAIDDDEIDGTPATISWTIGAFNPKTVLSEQPVKYFRQEE